MKLQFILLAPAFVLLLSSCGRHYIAGHGDVKTQTVALQSPDFDRVEIEAPVDAHITVGGPASLSFEGYANVIPHLRTEVIKGVLHIFTDDATDIHTDKQIIAHITVPALTGLDLSGSSDAVVAGAVNASDFSLDVSGASSVDIQDLHVKTFSADMSGSTNLTLRNGDIGNGNFEVSGSGEIYAFGVSQQSATLDLSGAAEAEVNVTGKLDVEISGAGSVLYKGHPAVSQDISGAGSVKAAD
jgi:hypothetical protein